MLSPPPLLLITPSPAARVASQTKKNVPMPSLLGALSPIKATSPLTLTPTVFSPPPPMGKENVSPTPASSGHGKTARTTRKPLGPRGPTPPTSPTTSLSPLSPSGKENAPAVTKKDKDARRSWVFKDVPATNRNAENTKALTADADAEVATPQRVAAKTPESRSNSVRDRMKAWERERERLREMEMLEERVREVDEERERVRRGEREMEEEVERERERERIGRAGEREQEEREKEERELEEEKERQAELEAERQRELVLAREKVLEREEGRARKRERESSLPRLNLLRGASLTPPDTVPPTPLTPLKEGERSLCLRRRTRSLTCLEESEPASPEGEYARGNESGISLFRQGLRMSIGELVS